MHYDLTTEPWIPVTMVDGSREFMGFREVLENAHKVYELDLYDPLTEAGMLRVLAALAYRITDTDTDIDHDAPLSDWKEQRDDLFGDVLDGNKCFNSERINNYFDMWHHRFDLFDEDRPWMQDARLRGSDKTFNQNNLVESITDDNETASGLNLLNYSRPFNGPIRANFSPGEAALLLTSIRLYGQGKSASSHRYFKTNERQAMFRKTSQKPGQDQIIGNPYVISSHPVGPFRGTASHFPRFGNLCLDLIATLMHSSAWGDIEYSVDDDLAPWETNTGSDRELGGFTVNRNRGFVSELTASNTTDTILLPSADYATVIGSKTGGAKPKNTYADPETNKITGEITGYTDSAFMRYREKSRPRDPFIAVVNRPKKDSKELNLVVHRSGSSASSWRNIGTSLGDFTANANFYPPEAIVSGLDIARQFEIPMSILTISHAGEGNKAVEHHAVRSISHITTKKYRDTRFAIKTLSEKAEHWGSEYTHALRIIVNERTRGDDGLNSPYWSQCDSVWNKIFDSIDFTTQGSVCLHNEIVRAADAGFRHLAKECIESFGMQLGDDTRLIRLGEAMSKFNKQTTQKTETDGKQP